LAEMLGKRLAILVSGKAGVGKTTTSKILKAAFIELGYATEIVPFASGLKNTALRLGWDGNKDSKGRQFLIELGLAGRNYDKDTWAKYTYENLIEHNSVNYDIILNDDWRYPNESEYVNRHPLYSMARIRIEAPDREILRNTPQYTDSSETSLPSYTNSAHGYYDYFIDNSGSMEKLEEQCKLILDDILDTKLVIY
jgi:hypothetical protein